MKEGHGRGFLPPFLALLATGTALQAWLVSRGGIGGDQYVLFDLGLDYLETGGLSAVGKGMSGGGFIPGSFLQLLIGVPFSIWRDYRSPVVLVGIFHLAAAVLSTLTVRRAAGDRPALIFLALCWLSPWRLYHSGLLWEPAYVFLPAALHLWACWSLRERAGAGASAVLAATLVLTLQLHGSFLFLALLTVVLFLRRRIRFQWQGGLLGAAAGSLTLIPAAAALVAGTLPSPSPTNSFFGYGLVTVVPVLKGAAYWFRLGSLDIGRRLKDTVFLREEWAGGDPALLFLKGATLALVALSAASVLLAAAATWWYFIKAGKETGRDTDWRWLRSYAVAAFASLLLSSALSPVTIQGWHVFIALTASCIPVALWIDEVWPSSERWLRTAIALFLLLRLPAAVVLGYGSEAYRLDPDIAAKLQPRQQTLLPPHLR